MKNTLSPFQQKAIRISARQQKISTGNAEGHTNKSVVAITEEIMDG
ncbi:MAG: hypothetical protein KDD01_04210 [Phaeodactylibacter sp.]|nr:hypothetical protein [Phaeodactylibacter sp.]